MGAPERELRAEDVDADPIVEFGRWFDDAVAHRALQPDAMTLVSVSADGVPSARMVLLRGVDERGFCFYTNFTSRKGRELDARPVAAIVFHWPEVLRQVRVTGRVERVVDAECDDYWASRPRASQVSAWASEQSEVVGSRDELEARVADLTARFAEGAVPRPPGWGGYRVVPHEIELWQHREDRLHDRLRYRRGDDATRHAWLLERLQP